MNETMKPDISKENFQEEVRKDLEGDYSNELYAMLGIFYGGFKKLRSFYERYDHKKELIAGSEMEKRIALVEAEVEKINELVSKMGEITSAGMERDKNNKNGKGKNLDSEEYKTLLTPAEKEKWRNLKAELFDEEKGAILKFYKAVNKEGEFNGKKSSRDLSAFMTAFDFAEKEKIQEI